MKQILLSLAILFAIGATAQQQTSIYDIQGQQSASPFDQQIVTTSGVVTSIVRDYAYFLQDGTGPWNGILIYSGDSAFVSGLNRGDEIEVTGKVNEYYDNTEIEELVSESVVSTGNTIPGPMQLTTGEVADEKHEGVFISVTNAVVTDTTIGYGEFSVDDGSGECFVNDKIYSYWYDNNAPIPDTAYDITGPLNFSFGDYKILPRDAADMVKSGEASIAGNFSFELSLYPNPVTNGKIKIESEKTIETIEIFNVLGKTIFAETSINNRNFKLSVNDVKDGIYIIKIKTTDNSFATRKLQIK